jgi:hypothetical protein
MKPHRPTVASTVIGDKYRFARSAGWPLERALRPGGHRHRLQHLLAQVASPWFSALTACALRWRDIDLAGGRLFVGQPKTDAGQRHVNLLPILRDELAVRKLSTPWWGPDTRRFGGLSP